MASPAPKSPELTEKIKKYDRQLRLWGDHGQSALEQAQVCLINATGVGTEILKSLVLPGIGFFTVVDGKKIEVEDIECNFFLDSDSVGKSRAEVATQLLVELNPDVKGDYIDEHIEQVLDNQPDFFNKFNVVIGTNLYEPILLLVASRLWDANIPFVSCRSYGLVATIRVQVKEHTVVESHPDNQHPDLRLDKPFPTLKLHIDSVDLESMELKDHAHVPYLVILFKYLEKWRKISGKELPSNFKEKQELRDLIRTGLLTSESGVPEHEENFEEAIKAVNTVITKTGIPSSVKSILQDEHCTSLTSSSKPFWIIAKAISEFVENEGDGMLPLRGAVPDMTAETTRYITLQQIYRNEAAREAELVYRRVQQILHELNLPQDSVTEMEVKTFCKHITEISLTRGSSISEEHQGKNALLQNIVSELEPPDSVLLLYALLRGVDKFHSEHSMYPGELTQHVEPDLVTLKSIITRLLCEWGAAPLATDDYIHEMCRYGACELHAVSALIGGCAAQEVIKIITKQYKLLDNTFIYDVINSTSATFKF